MCHTPGWGQTFGGLMALYDLDEIKGWMCMMQSFIYSPTDALVSCLKKTVLKFTLKHLQTCFGVTVTPSSGRAKMRSLMTVTPKYVGDVLM